MIGRTNVGGGGRSLAFAYIRVSYPAGGTVRCTDGRKIFVAKDTTGTYVFGVPYAATWTITLTASGSTSSQNVVITSQYQVENVAISIWNGVAYDDTGNEYTSVTGGWGAPENITPPSGSIYAGYFSHTTYDNKYVMIIAPKPYSVSTKGYYFAQTQNKVDVTLFNKMSFTAAAGSSYPVDVMLYLSNSKSGEMGQVAFAGWYERNVRGEFAEFNKDISNITGAYYITLAARTVNYYDIQENTPAYISEVRFYND